jgi:hypothetical protein
LKRIASEGDNPKRIQRLNRLFPLLRQFNIRPNLSRSQNLYFEISRANPTHNGKSVEWVEEFGHLGDSLSVKVK